MEKISIFIINYLQSFAKQGMIKKRAIMVGCPKVQPLNPIFDPTLQ